ncbi:hypothetical protein HDU79_001525 [Rhizoclosmatium sp. JEL0117]|nr:hypothetical protein HDU79_001525 [Rhizoclosmatium sp. JEL0117]
MIAGYRFRNQSLLQKALNHPSLPSISGSDHSFQRLEFLGDAVLKLTTTDYLLSKYPQEDEGKLNHRLEALVNGSTCKDMAFLIGLDKMLKVGLGTDLKQSAILADAFEAVIGSVYEDSGKDMKVTGAWLLQVMERLPQKSSLEKTPAEVASSRHPKAALQEYAQKLGGGLPEYILVGQTGAAHDPLFTIKVAIPTLNSSAVGLGSDRSRRAAETSAAADLLRQLRV